MAAAADAFGEAFDCNDEDWRHDPDGKSFGNPREDELPHVELGSLLLRLDSHLALIVGLPNTRVNKRGPHKRVPRTRGAAVLWQSYGNRTAKRNAALWLAHPGTMAALEGGVARGAAGGEGGHEECGVLGEFEASSS